VARYIRRRIGHCQREVFGCLFLDTRHRPICWEILFQGTLNRAHVHSREILKRAMELNAAALVLGHNHPSGIAEPSAADLTLTRELKDLLARVDVAVLDHIVAAPRAAVSMASRGLLGAL
jgi:DNA repair protein RadC